MVDRCPWPRFRRNGGFTARPTVTPGAPRGGLPRPGSVSARPASPPAEAGNLAERLAEGLPVSVMDSGTERLAPKAGPERLEPKAGPERLEPGLGAGVVVPVPLPTPDPASGTRCRR